MYQKDPSNTQISPIYRISEELKLIREQLELFQISPDVSHKKFIYHDDDWDYAQADTKTETHCFHPYPAMMIPQVARRLIRMYGKRGDTVLDPFCGSGTVLVEAQMAGLNSYGIDINPLALLIARAKTTPLDMATLRQLAISLLHSYLEDCCRIEAKPDYAPIPDFFNIEYWFKPSVSRELSALRSRLLAIEDISVQEFFLVAFSETVREASYTRNNEFKLFRIPKDKLKQYNPNVGEIFFRKVYRNLNGMKEYLRKADKNVWVKILSEDTREKTTIPAQSVNLVVTSPPYGDSKTTVAYGQFSRLSLQWLGLPCEEARDIDNRSLGGRRLTTLDDVANILTLKEPLEQIAAEDSKRALEVGSFYHDFSLCFREIARVCALSAKACFVVGNRTVKSVCIPTDRILVELGERYGFSHIDTFHRNIPNKRMPSKNSPSNAPGELGSTMTKEHIIVLEKTLTRA
ncbi:MAG: DNA methyltransferase [Candidatus Poribacteria bacterium]